MRAATWIAVVAAATAAAALGASAGAAAEPEHFLINGVRLDFRERHDRLRGEIAGTVGTLFDRKQAIEREIERARDRVAAAVDRQNVVQAKWATLRDRHRATRTALWRLQLAERRLRKESTAGHEQVIAQIGARIARLEGMIVSRTRAGLGTAAHRRLLGRQRRTLVDVQAGLVARGPAETRDLRRKWLTMLTDTHELLFDVHVENAAAEHARATSLDELTALLRERDELDRRAYNAALQLASMDFDVREVRVKAGGSEVFRTAGSTAQYEKIKRVRTEIELARQLEDGLRPEFDRVRHAFYSAQRDVIEAEADLAGRLDYLAYARFTTDLAFAFIDVAMAYGSAGPAGAVTELAKKRVERDFSLPAASGYEPGSVEAEVNARYNAELKDALSYPQLMKTGMERVAKEILTKPGKDVLNRGLAWGLFRKFGKNLPADPVDLAGRPLNPTSLRALADAPKRFGHANAQITKLRESGPSLRGLGLTLLKDVAKVAAKSKLDDYEREAWIRFFERDVYARARYAIYETARDLYAAAEATRQHNELLMLEYARAGISLESGFATQTSKQVARGTQLEVEVWSETAMSPQELTLSIAIGSQRVAPVARRREGEHVVLTYRFGAAALRQVYLDTGRYTIQIG